MRILIAKQEIEHESTECPACGSEDIRPTRQHDFWGCPNCGHHCPTKCLRVCLANLTHAFPADQ